MLTPREHPCSWDAMFFLCGKIMGPCCGSSRSSRAEQLHHLWCALGGCLSTVAAPGPVQADGQKGSKKFRKIRFCGMVYEKEVVHLHCTLGNWVQIR